MTCLSPLSRRLVRLLLAAVLAAAATASPAQDAADAVLALPQGVPDDSVFPTGHGDIADEPALLEQLANDATAGDDVNAYRFGGTALHHALRANLQDTALWLLAHGADPKLEVQSVENGKPDGNDALQLAIVYRRWRVVDALLRRPAIAPHTPRDVAFRWTGVFDLHADAATQDDAARELARRLAWPGGWQGGCLVVAAANRAILPMLAKADGAPVARCPAAFSPTLDVRDSAVAGAAVPPALNFAGDADAAAAAPSRLARLASAELARLDARLLDPLLPALAPLLDTPADAQAWSTLPLRRPWQDAAFSRAVVQALLRTRMTAEVRDVALRSVPPAALRAALDDDATLNGWFDPMRHQPLPQAMASLAAIDDATLARHADAAVTGLAGVPPHVYSKVPYARQSLKAPEPLWAAMLSRLPATQPWGADLSILMLAPVSTWPLVLAHGDVPTVSRLESVWLDATPDEWRDLWPRLRPVVRPDVATAMVAGLLARWAKPCDAQEACTPSADDAAKLQQVLAAGVRPPPAVTLSSAAAHRAGPDALRALVATRLVVLAPADAALSEIVAAAPPDVAPRGRFERAPLACAAAPDTAIVRAALHAGFLLDGPPLAPARQADAPGPDWFQPVAEPGAKACAWLVSGGDVSTRMSFDDDDFYEGRHHFTPCGDPTLHGELWRMVDGRLVATPWDEGATGGAVALAEAGGARRFVLALPFHGGTCSAGQPTQLYEWVGDASNRHLVPRPAEGPSRTAFDAQCNAEDPAPCFGLPSIDDNAIQPDSPETMLLQSTFLERYGGPLRQRWIDAFLALDVVALRSPDLSAPMPEWRQAGLIALTASPLPLDQKRQRIAWMFRDKAGMAASFGTAPNRDPALLGLVAWLPREDWRPMLAAIGQDEKLLLSLRDAATARGDARLACTFARATGRDCGVPPANKP